VQTIWFLRDGEGIQKPNNSTSTLLQRPLGQITGRIMPWKFKATVEVQTLE
jgi:hypothetical protein